MNIAFSIQNHSPRSVGQAEEKLVNSISKPKSRRVERRHSEKSTCVALPRDSDVLCGRGRGYFEHSGNRRMLAIISQFKSEYQTASKLEKSAITHRVLQLILNPRDGCARPRFLKKENGKKKGGSSTWSELCDKEVHKKVAHTLREQKSIVKLSSMVIHENLQELDESSSAASTCSTEEEWFDDGEREQSGAQRSPSMHIFKPTTDLSRFVSLDVNSTQIEKKMLGRTCSTIEHHGNSIFVMTKTSLATHSVGDASMTGPYPVSDDESSAPHEYIEVFATPHWRNHEGQVENETKDVGLRGKVLDTMAVPTVADEPLGYEEEPIFDEKDIDSFLNTVMDDVDHEDNTLLYSFLDGLVESL